MKSHLVIGILVASVGLSRKALADHQEIHGDASVLRLEDLIREALKNNVALKVEEHSADLKTAMIAPAGALENPELGFEARNYPVGRGNAGLMQEREVSLSQRVPFPGKRLRLEAAARSDAEAQSEDVRTKRSQIVADVTNAYFELDVAYRALDVLNDQQNVLRSLLATARKQYALGKIPQAEVLNLQLEDTDLINRRLEAERKIKAVLGEINHLLGRSDHGHYVAGRPAKLDGKRVQFGPNAEAEMLEKAFGKNPKLTARRAAVAASEAKAAYYNLNMWPDFDVKVGYTFRDQNPERENRNSVSAMVGVSLPLWAGSRQSEERKQAAAEKMRVVSLLEEDKSDLAHRIHLVVAELEEASKRLDLFESAIIPVSQQALASARSGYLTGKVQFSTLVELVRKRSQIELDYAQTQATYHMKTAELEQLTGASLEKL